MENWEKIWKEWETYCKEVAEYYLQKYMPTKLEMLELASKNQKYCWLCGGDYSIERWRAILPGEFMNKQIEKLRSFNISMQHSIEEIFEWVMNFTFPELGGAEGFFKRFTWDHLFWQLNLQYYKRKQRTIFQDYQLPYFDWEALDFWGEEERKTWKSEGGDKRQIGKEHDNIKKQCEEYCKQVLQIAADAVAYL